jgi:iron(III) transport system ATP-binding protein
MLEVKSLSRRVKKKEIVSDVSFRLEAGRILAVLGPSGSGKSSLLRLIAGLETPDQGSVSWEGTSLSDAGLVQPIVVPPENRGFGVVFQDAALFPHLSVLDNVAFGLTQLPREERLKRAQQELEKLNLNNLIKRRVDFLSGGERQRVALARALAPGRRLLLLDEPFSNVDRLARHDLIRSLKATFAASKTTVLMVTHDARDAIDIGAESLLLLNNGRVVRHGSVTEILNSPGDDWTKHFLKCSFGRDQ